MSLMTGACSRVLAWMLHTPLPLLANYSLNSLGIFSAPGSPSYGTPPRPPAEPGPPSRSSSIASSDGAPGSAGSGPSWRPCEDARDHCPVQPESLNAEGKLAGQQPVGLPSSRGTSRAPLRRPPAALLNCCSAA
ncbi:hypothetical protein LZ30DRAFT_302475 [Colletotrichum cereale]|nr:hypothetical protein LZ30DRAFT_302475 [Colletotrichum cereale]